jgi:hypothetical protein
VKHLHLAHRVDILLCRQTDAIGCLADVNDPALIWRD